MKKNERLQQQVSPQTPGHQAPGEVVEAQTAAKQGQELGKAATESRTHRF